MSQKCQSSGIIWRIKNILNRFKQFEEHREELNKSLIAKSLGPYLENDSIAFKFFNQMQGLEDNNII